MICNRLLWISCSSNSLSDSQHGFLEGRTTETAAHSFVLCWNCFLFVVVHCLCVFYIKSAFNSAWHPAILAALIKRACSSYLIKVVKDFLLDINTKLSLNNEFIIKSWLAIKWGAFPSIILVDDLLRCSFPFPVIMFAYANDTTVGVSNKDPQNAIRHLFKSCAMFLLTGVIKTNFL